MSAIPSAGTPVDQRIYNEACHKISDLEEEIKRVTYIAKRRLAWLNYYRGLWNGSGPDAKQPPFRDD